jgi:oligogalacturonide lyase
MRSQRGATTLWPRRAILGAALGLPLVADERDAPSERRRFQDETTELEVVRETDPAIRCVMPRPYNRVFSKRNRFLLYASERSGTLQAWSMDLKDGKNRRLTNAANLDPASLTLTPDDRTLCYIDNGWLWTDRAEGGKARRIASLAGYRPGSGIGVTSDGRSVLAPDGTDLRRIPLRGRGERVVATGGPFRDSMARPAAETVLFRGPDDSLWTAKMDGGASRLALTAGQILDFRWAPDGSVVFYLWLPDNFGRTVYLREHDPDTGEDREIALTSQYSAFGVNEDGTVFVGVSFSKAQPHVLLLLRSVRREMTLCAHWASDAAAAAPVFTPDSQSVYFQSDREGKAALYSMRVDKLVEQTGS